MQCHVLEKFETGHFKCHKIISRELKAKTNLQITTCGEVVIHGQYNDVQYIFASAQQSERVLVDSYSYIGINYSVFIRGKNC